MITDPGKRAIGCAILDTAAADNLLRRVRPIDFPDKADRAVVALMLRERQNGLPIDGQKLARDLKGEPQFVEGNAPAYIMELADAAAFPEHLDTFLDTVLRESGKRQRNEGLETALAHARNGYSPEQIDCELESTLEDWKRQRRTEIQLPTLATIEPCKPDFIWQPRLPRGMFTICDGDPGLGKSQVAIAIGASVTVGRPMPLSNAARGEPASILSLASEDDNRVLVRPRYEAAGADINRVHFWPEGADPISFPSGVGRLADAIKRFDIKLLITDPVTAYLDEEINANRDADVRRALKPVVLLMQETGCAWLGVRHLNKDSGKASLYRGGGSVAWIASARVGWAIAIDPDDANRRILAVNKCNIAQRPSSIMFSIESCNDVSRVRWEGESEYTAADILAYRPYGENKREQAAGIIRAMLTAGARPEPEVQQACQAAGIGVTNYRQARKKLNIQPFKSGMDGGWWLELPEGANFG